MFSVMYDRQAELIAWTEARIPENRFRADAKAIGVTRNGEICGVAVFDNFSVGSCCVSVASDGSRRWITREFLIRVFAYPFLQLGYRRLTCFIAASNRDSIRLCQHLGWVREGVLRQGSPDGDDLIVLGLLRSECRFLPERMAGKMPRASI